MLNQLEWVPRPLATRRANTYTPVHDVQSCSYAGRGPLDALADIRAAPHSGVPCVEIYSNINITDMPQFRRGNPYFFSENPYQSVSFIHASKYREKVHAIHIAMQFAKKSRHCVITIDSQQQRTKIGALLHVARQSDLGLGPTNQIKSILFIHRNFRKRFRGVYSAKNQLMIDEVNHAPPKRNLPFFGNSAEKASCVMIKLLYFATHIHKLFFSNLPQIRITT